MLIYLDLDAGFDWAATCSTPDVSGEVMMRFLRVPCELYFVIQGVQNHRVLLVGLATSAHRQIAKERASYPIDTTKLWDGDDRVVGCTGKSIGYPASRRPAAER